MSSAKFKYNWTPRKRNYDEERKEIEKYNPWSKTLSMSQQPLHDHMNSKQKKNVAIHKESVSKKQPPQKTQPLDDPLNSAAANKSNGDEEILLGADPLSKEDTQKVEDKLEENIKKPGALVVGGALNRSQTRRQRSDVLNWKLKKPRYLAKYTTNKTIPVHSKILSTKVTAQDDRDDIIEQENGGPVVTVEDRIKMRLDQLERDSKPQDVSYMTQKEYISHLEKLNVDLRNAWNSNDRVLSLKIVIKCTKILSLNNVPQFYPSMFVLVSEVLDQFGELVYNRLKDKAATVDYLTGRVFPIPKNFTAADVNDDAKEVTKNWFYKIASIRELISRTYVQMALLPCHQFLEEDIKAKWMLEFNRISKIIRGFGDPLVAAFARLYLAKKGYQLIPDYKEYVLTMFDDLFYVKSVYDGTSSQDAFFNQHSLNAHQYYELFGPVIEWLLEMIGENGNEALFQRILQKYEAQKYHASIFLNYIIRAFDAHIISHYADPLVYMIKSCDETTMPKHLLYLTLGEKFATCPPLESQKLQLLNEIWKDITQLQDLNNFVPLVEIYIEFVCKNFSLREVNILLQDLRKHLAKASEVAKESTETSETQEDKKESKAAPISYMNEKIENDLSHILLNILENTEDVIHVFHMENFLPIFDMLKRGTQIEVSKGLLVSFAKNEMYDTAEQREQRRTAAISASDPVVLYSLLELAKTVHDSVNHLSEEHEKEQIEHSLTQFVNKIDFGTAFEKQLLFYVECRKAFSTFDRVKQALCMKVLQMVSKTYQFVKGKHTKKTHDFVKACLAFVHITIPAIDEIFTRLYLFVLAGQISISNNLLAQGEVLLKTAVESIQDIPPLIIKNNQATYSTESNVIQFVRYMTSCLIATPGHPEFGPFYLLKGLLNALNDYPWPKYSDAKIQCFISVLLATSAYYQENLPYYYVGVSSSDALYSADQAYLNDIFAIGNTILDEVLKQMSILTEDEDISAIKKQTFAALDLCNVLLSTSLLRTPQQNSPVLNLLVNLIQLIEKNNAKQETMRSAAGPYLRQTLHYLKSISTKPTKGKEYTFLWEDDEISASIEPYQKLYQKFLSVLAISNN